MPPMLSLADTTDACTQNVATLPAMFTGKG